MVKRLKINVQRKTIKVLKGNRKIPSQLWSEDALHNFAKFCIAEREKAREATIISKSKSKDK